VRFERVVFGILAIVLASAPIAEAGHGGWWRGRDEPTTSPVFPAPGSTATSRETGEVFRLDLKWGGGGGVAGVATIDLYEQAHGRLVHTNTFAALEDVSSVTWVPCPFPNSSGVMLETVPLYSVLAPGILSLGPGLPDGSGDHRTSYCDDATVPDAGDPFLNDPLYYKAFSDLTGTYLASAPGFEGLFELDVHVRNLDHG
jgi:hypothetical protein